MLRDLTLYLLATVFMLFSSPALSQVRQGSAVLKYYEKAHDSDLEKFREVLSTSLEFYIQQQIEIDDDKLVWAKKNSAIKQDLNTIVKSAIKYYNFKELDAFRGFSDDVSNQIEAMSLLDFSSFNDFNKKWSEAEINRKKYVFFQAEISKLKLLLDTEIGKFSNENLLQFSSEENVEVSQAFIDSVMAANTYKAEDPLMPQDIEWSEATKKLLQQEDNSTLGSKESNSDLTPFEKQILEMLTSNNSKLDMMQFQIDQLKADQLALFQKQQEATNNQLQAQIDDLRGMVIELVKLSNNAELASFEDLNLGSGANVAIENMPSSISIYFDKNKSDITAQYQMVLVEVVDIMARNPRLKLLLTGMADQTGNADLNLALSKKRADEVKKFLSRSGLSQDRFITKYYGDSQSKVESAVDRKVVLEFLAQ